MPLADPRRSTSRTCGQAFRTAPGSVAFRRTGPEPEHRIHLPQRLILVSLRTSTDPAKLHPATAAAERPLVRFAGVAHTRAIGPAQSSGHRDRVFPVGTGNPGPALVVAVQ